GLFVLGAAVRRANAQGALIGLVAGGVSIALLFSSTITPWWYGAFTCIPTLAGGAFASLLFPPPPREKVQGLLIGDSPKIKIIDAIDTCRTAHAGTVTSQ